MLNTTTAKVAVLVLMITGITCGCAPKPEAASAPAVPAVPTAPGATVAATPTRRSLEQVLDSNPNMSADQKAQEKAKLVGVPQVNTAPR